MHGNECNQDEDNRSKFLLVNFSKSDPYDVTYLQNFSHKHIFSPSQKFYHQSENMKCVSKIISCFEVFKNERIVRNCSCFDLEDMATQSYVQITAEVARLQFCEQLAVCCHLISYVFVHHAHGLQITI